MSLFAPKSENAGAVKEACFRSDRRGFRPMRKEIGHGEVPGGSAARGGVGAV